jgi:hypothetical protein
MIIYSFPAIIHMFIPFRLKGETKKAAGAFPAALAIRSSLLKLAHLINKILVEKRNSFDSLVEIEQGIIFIGRMDGI